MSVSERIKELCDFEGSQLSFAKKTGIQSQTISKIIARGSEIRSDNILAIAEAYPNLSMQWFITGKGAMWMDEDSGQVARSHPMSDEEKELLKDEIIALQKKRIKELEREIQAKNPELAKRLGIE